MSSSFATRAEPLPGGPGADNTWRALHEAASAPYRSAGRFAWHFARGKLGHDPVFRGMLERGLLRPQVRVLDIGCGQGLLAALLRAVDVHSGRWPEAWPAAPAGATYTGVELMQRDIDRAEAALGPSGLGLATGDRPGRAGLHFLCADMCRAAFPPADVVVILDVLHYVDHVAQLGVLRRVRDALGPQGRLLLRVGDAASRRGFAVSQWVDRTVTRIRGHRVSPTFGRPLAAWVAQLEQLGFVVRSLPMSRGTPFANVLLVADLPAGR